MKKWGGVAAGLAITVEGHCDSRGSAEYNLALGSRRADAVKDYLVNLGVPASRLTVVSKGKEQPSAPKRTSPAGSRTAADTSSLRRNRQDGREGQDGRETIIESVPSCLSCRALDSRQHPSQRLLAHPILRRFLPVHSQHRNFQAVARFELAISRDVDLFDRNVRRRRRGNAFDRRFHLVAQMAARPRVERSAITTPVLRGTRRRCARRRPADRRRR